MRKQSSKKAWWNINGMISLQYLHMKNIEEIESNTSFTYIYVLYIYGK